MKVFRTPASAALFLFAMLAQLLLPLAIAANTSTMIKRSTGIDARKNLLKHFPDLILPEVDEEPAAVPPASIQKRNPAKLRAKRTSERGKGGPSTPEVQQFTPYDANNLVDPFTGDFNFNIPLLDVGGYPVTLNYTSGMGIEDEASFVGLGWNLNPGAINRQVRGLPDDLDGDMVKKTFNMAPEEKIGVNTGFSAEFVGLDAAKFGGGLGLDFSYDNYEGWEVGLSLSPSISAGGNGDSKLEGSLSAEIGLNNRSGAFFNPHIGMEGEIAHSDGASQFGVGIGAQISSVEGLKSIDFGANYQRKWANSERKSPKLQLGSSISFVQPTYTPGFNMPMSHYSFSLDIKVGGEVPLTALSGSIGGHYSRRQLHASVDSLPAYGFLYAQHASEGRVLHDFNREKDGPYIRENPNLPLTNFTYDIYSATGQGLSAQFRPFRGDIGAIHDPANASTDIGGTVGAEISIGQFVHAGVDVGVNHTSNAARKWTEGNGLNEFFRFRDFNPANPAFEPVYFKSMGELTEMRNPALFQSLGAFEPVSARITGNGQCDNALFSGSRRLAAPAGGFLRQEREPRNEVFSTLNAREARLMAFEKILPSHTYASDGRTTVALIDRVGGPRKAHHLSELTVTRNDGARYIYGIPVYNALKKQVSFNATGLTETAGTGLVSYTPGTDNSTANTRGKNHYFNAEETPAHAYAYLLTAVLSTDYVDITGDGPTADDFGSYTKFNYTRVATNYRWRAPYQENQAQLNAGFESDPEDNMGSYLYGEKEVWYLAAIETRTYVAEFSLSADRLDARGARGENGGRDDGQRLRKLDKIALYAKNDRLNNGAIAVPIKTVHFEYDYSLCPGIPSSTSGNGKLTLKKLSFTYANSEKGRFSPYEFYYDFNPSYALNRSDRWGTYKTPRSAALDNDRFPYAAQDANANRNAAAWLLTRIKMPMSDTLSIHYEADDYAFVQQKRAMEMVPVVGFAKTPTGSAISNVLFDAAGPNDILFFTLKQTTSDSNALREYVTGLEKLYFNNMIRVHSGTAGTDGFEAVSGFVNVRFNRFNTDFGFRDANTGWLRLPRVGIGDDGDTPTEHPCSKATWQELRKSLMQYAFEAAPPSNNSDVLAFLDAVGGALSRVTTFFHNIYADMKSHDKGKEIRPDGSSFIRLNSPDQRKLGGGTRVKKLKISDAWGTMQDLPWLNFDYEQEYTYTLPEPWSGGSRNVSAGVAAYEPLIGGDENPFALPVEFTVGKVFAIDLFLKSIQPFGESFFPAPVVGYRQMRVRNLPKPGIQTTATGYTQYEHYTAKDFPTFVRQTEKAALDHSPFPISTPFIALAEQQTTVSQGYCIETNNMHGRFKAKRVFNQSGVQVSAQEHRYKTEAAFPNRLDNRVTVIDEGSGSPDTRMLGVDYDFVLDAQEFAHESNGPEVQINSDGFWAGPIYIMLPLPFPSYSHATTRYRGLTATKVIYRSGILEEVTNIKLDSRLSARNTAWDALTGDVLITQTDEAFGGAYFDTKMPARWVYAQGMGPAYTNLGISAAAMSMSGGQLQSPNNEQSWFRPGDELMLRRLDSFETVRIFGLAAASFPREISPVRAWVLGDPAGTKYIIDENGRHYPRGQYSMRILRSGQRNMQAASLGSIATLSNPLSVPGRANTLYFDRVLDASALEYGNYWQTYTGFNLRLPRDSCNCTMDVNTAQAVRDFAANLIRSSNLINETLNVSTVAGAGILNRAIGTLTDYAVRREGRRLVVRLVGTSGTCTFAYETEDGRLYPSQGIDIPAAGLVPLFESKTCEDSYGFYLNGKYEDQFGSFSVRLRVTTSCFKIVDCINPLLGPAALSCVSATGGIVNPFLLGILGNWRPTANYKYTANRLNSGPAESNGVFESFSSFWYLPGTFRIGPAFSRINWQRADRSTLIDPYGKILENKDALGRFATELHGYGFNLPIASIGNARHAQAAFDGFEDYEYRNTASTPFSGGCPLPPHWKVPLGASARINTADGHTGKRCLEVTGPTTVTRAIVSPCEWDRGNWTPARQYNIQTCDLIGTFAPGPGKYAFSIWAKHPGTILPVSYTAPYATLRIQTTAGLWETKTLRPGGPVIEGWQQIADTLLIAAGARQIEIILGSDSGSALFDDCRMLPFNAAMKSYVYDPVNVRLMAVLDENNFATFYEYDQEGLLTRTKRETEDGVVTVQETRNGKPKQ